MRLIGITLLILVTLSVTQAQHPNSVVYTDDADTARQLLGDLGQLTFIERDTAPAHVTPPQVVTFETASEQVTLWVPLLDISARLEQQSHALTVSLPPILYSAPVSRSDQQTIAGLIAYGSGDCTTAGVYWEDSTHPAIHFFRGNCALINGHDDIALMQYRAALNDPIAAPYATINQIWLAINIGDEATAREQLAALVIDDESAAEQANLLAHRARLHALLFDYTAAITDLNTALELQPDDSRLLRWLGEMHLLTYEWDEAESYFSQAIDSAPHIAANYYQRGILRYTMARREDALTDFQQAYSLAPFSELAQSALNYIASIQQEIDALKPPSD